jgi:phage tail sheath protein FI
VAHLSSDFREVQLIAALPMPREESIADATENPDGTLLAREIHQVLNSHLSEVADLAKSASSAFLQLAYPWLKTTGSHVLLESLEPPDGALAGILARNALTRGTFTSATKVTPAEVYDIWPPLPPEELRVPAAPPNWGDDLWKPLIQRISLFGFTPAGLRLLSDVTAYPGEAYRPGRVNRLVAVIRRASRRMAEGMVFDSNGEVLWARVEASLRHLMTRLWTLGALEGARAKDAFSVRCDRSTMTQNDLDNGRLTAELTFAAAATIEVIRVTLAVETSATSAAEIAATQVGVA